MTRLGSSRARVAMSNLGCRVNRVELDAIARELEAAGCELVKEDDADAIVINTCAVTSEAEAKARKAVRHAAGLPQEPIVLATGCVASLFAPELEALAANVIVEADKALVAGRVLSELGVDCASGGLGAMRSHGSSVTPTGRMRPGLKIQDGCDNRCTYCIVWKARGAARSVSPDEVLSGVRSLIEDGAREVVLTGIDLGRYEFEGLDLAGLLVRILEETEVARLRLSSIEPAGVTDELLRVMANSEGGVAPFLHIPLQSGCDATLSRMGRPYTVAEYEEVVERARAALPGVAIACDLIVAFPGETDEEFSESLATCERIAFSKMHVFRYSRRPGTVAASMVGQVDPVVSAERGRLMRECAAASRHSYAESLVGSEQLVLVEHDARGVTGGLVDVVVDEGHLGELISVVPSGLTPAGLLDARS